MTCAFYAERPYTFEDLDPSCQFELGQFPSFAPDFVAFKGKKWCPFHLPVTLEDGETKSSKAKWDEKRIREFNDAVFAFIDEAKKNKSPADLTGVEFPGFISFVGYSDDNPLPPICFAGARFNDTANFFETHFSGVAEFSKISFRSSALFDNVGFGDIARFSETRFGRHAVFSGARFGSVAEFNAVQFGDLANFAGAQFELGALFSGALFDGVAWFHSVWFGREVDFSSSAAAAAASSDEGKGDSNPSPGRFSSRVNFNDARFEGAVRFANRNFLDETSFSGAVFAEAPDFHNCALHQDTDFAGTAFKQFRGGMAARAYRTLKLAMEGHRARREEARFYGLEQKSLLFSRETGPIDKLFSALYWVFANYGQTAWLPLIWLVILQFGFAWLYPEIFPELSAKEFDDTLRFSLRQVFRPFDIFREAASGPRYSLPLVVTAAGQSIATYGLFALFLLALRRRFRMG